ncbi:arsenate reductase ArsC [Sphingopyxis alaskensis]|uniref:Protein tyrosine phosphatase n=1 Tax=Sphingopyxis alaskensis (strain DSM 13593 / LMG 18877 / RB2256) TaxID=317655 RepID=Q1GQM6_SPHAL|nr:arsenate reductase ArsC [Sphingopyxis alaskensis]ABF54046.1 protein tyrosine phosphatase [Sphingopyxis alaskensis RB2256]MCM3418879.1 arsenate reductase ArsC [Sphingopyxis alaskensis]
MTGGLGVLVLCTGNSARSILGEALVGRMGEGRLTAFSAGSKPRGAPHPAALRLLRAKGFDVAAFRSKSWDEFAAPGAPRIDIAITVCGNAAGEACPLFTGAPVRAHWGLADPADAPGGAAAEDAAFAETWRLLEMRVAAMLALPLETMTAAERRATLNAIGQMEGAA